MPSSRSFIANGPSGPWHSTSAEPWKFAAAINAVTREGSGSSNGSYDSRWSGNDDPNDTSMGETYEAYEDGEYGIPISRTPGVMEYSISDGPSPPSSHDSADSSGSFRTSESFVSTAPTSQASFVHPNNFSCYAPSPSRIRMDQPTAAALGYATPPSQRGSPHDEFDGRIPMTMPIVGGCVSMEAAEMDREIGLDFQSEIRAGGSGLVEVDLMSASGLGSGVGVAGKRREREDDGDGLMDGKKNGGGGGGGGNAATTTKRQRQEQVEKNEKMKKAEQEASNNPPPVKMDRDAFVDGLVGTTVLAINSIWSNASENRQTPSEWCAEHGSPSTANEDVVLPIRWFIKEVLRRTRTTCSVLQTALYYLHKSRRSIRDRVSRAERAQKRLHAIAKDSAKRNGLPSPPPSPPRAGETMTIPTSPNNAAEVEQLISLQHDPVLCGRRMFLASLICASKFLQDRNYSNRAWAKISGLEVAEINSNERAFLALVHYQLHVDADVFSNWTERLMKLAQKQGKQVEAKPTNGPSLSRVGLGRHATEPPPESRTETLRRPEDPTVSRARSNKNAPRQSSHLSNEVVPESQPQQPTPNSFSRPINTLRHGATVASLGQPRNVSRMPPGRVAFPSTSSNASASNASMAMDVDSPSIAPAPRPAPRRTSTTAVPPSWGSGSRCRTTSGSGWGRSAAEVAAH